MIKVAIRQCSVTVDNVANDPGTDISDDSTSLGNDILLAEQMQDDEAMDVCTATDVEVIDGDD